MNSTPPLRIALALLAGSTALVVVHSLGRFAFTPLLPYLIADGLIDLEQGARLATWNYIGYLLGALLALVMHRPSRLRIGLPVALLTNALLTLAQGFTADYDLLLWLRLANGISNGLVFVMAPALVLEWLAQRQRAGLSGLVYLGVPIGLLVSNVLANLPTEQLHSAQRWWPMAALALPLALLSSWQLGRLKITIPARVATAPETLFDRISIPLFLAYAGAGLGYILPMTFLPTLARQLLPAGDPLITGAWQWTAIACLASIPLWNHLGARLGDRRALAASYPLQALGAAAPLLWPGHTGVLLCALLVGGTFAGSVLLTQRLARHLQPHQGIRLSAALIALYGVAQLLGPWLAELWLAHGGDLTQSFAIGAGALLWAWFWAWLTPSTPKTRID
ncbi:YbfB/YjiJ family MFS transporter [Azomonas macrocytogenes]|uniref:MFS family permease n=1 Tax=Azomonas macrocytogenes TaxID=69962 RepID=A0A839T3K0_AZOMA|nr:YbfB/YjiJ family MFS transporter [Azomonas macrocytogenes]MBB3102924.1 MFS family permease [Azomonas macrocytogenes]